MADYVKKRTHIINHPRFLEAGAVARDLYDWGMLWSGQLETDGAIPMVAVMASPWGAVGKKNVVVAQKLVDVGLWERTDTGYRICRWAEQGNITKAELVAKREYDRDRKAKQRSRQSEPCPGPVSDGCPTGTPSGIPTSLSSSTSGTGSPSGGAGGAMPVWFVAACGTAGMSGCDVPEAEQPARWVQFLGSMERRKHAPTQTLAASWLVTTIRAEREKAANDRERRGSRSGAEVTKQGYDEKAPWMKVGA